MEEVREATRLFTENEMHVDQSNLIVVLITSITPRQMVLTTSILSKNLIKKVTRCKIETSRQ
jgi:hypothetical protein